MPELRIATTGPEGFRRLGLHGQAVVEMHRQIATILNNRLGVQHARYFARPQIDPSSRRIDWYCRDDGPLARPADLPAETRAAVETLARQLGTEIAQLAKRLKAEGATGEFVGQMLELAQVTPAGADCLRATGGQPVLILWGHEAEGVAVSVDATAPPAQQAPPKAGQAVPPASALNAGPPPGKGAGNNAGWAVSGAGSASDAGGGAGSGAGRADAGRSTDGNGGSAGFGSPGPGGGMDTGLPGAAGPGGTAPAGWGGRLAWGMPLLLLGLVAVLSMKACEPLPPVAVQVPEPAAPAVNPIPALESREKELRDRLALLDRQRADALAQCRPAEPLKKAEIPPPPPETPPPAPQQDVRLPDPPVPPPEAVPIRPAMPPPAPPKVEVPKAEAPAVTESKPAAPPPSLSSIIGAIPDEDKTLPPRPVPQVHAQTQTAPGPAAPGKTPAAPSCNVTYPPGKEPEVVLIVDGSGSMNETFHDSTKIGMARRSIANLANSLPPPVSIGLIDFNGCSNVVRHDFYDAGRRGELIRKVQGLSPSGGTPLARSIERAGNVVSSIAPATIIVVSDGEDTCSGDPCAAARSVKAHKPNVTINVVDISNGSGGQVLQCIAGATGGRVLSPQSGADMINKMQQATRLPDVRNCK